VQTLLVDDLDGSPADHADFPFALDGKQYEIDLSAENQARLLEAVAPFIAAARRTGRGRQPVKPAKRSKDTPKIRAWARENNWDIADRGRIPAEVLEAYENRDAS
jgi:hypothetical protein